MKINSSLKQSDQHKVDKLILDFLHSWNDKDEVAYAALFTEDAEYTAVTKETYIGRDTIANKHIYPFTVINRLARLTFDEVWLRYIGPNIIFFTAQWTVKGSVDEKGNKLSPREGVLNAIVKVDDSNTLISHVFNTDIGAQYFD